MEGKKQSGSSSSSFTNELFGSKDSSSSSSGIFGSSFAPSPKVLGRESLHSEGKRQDSTNEAWNNKSRAQDGYKSSEGLKYGEKNQDKSSIYQEQQKTLPCHLSSSIYYGGPDVFSHPPNSEGPGFNSTYKKDGSEDDSGAASRGNWWQGSLYY